MTSLCEERRAYELLQWVPFSLPSTFDDDLAAVGHYTKLQRERSNAALDAWDKAHPEPESPELAAFHALEKLGIYTQNDFFSPSKAQDGYYVRRLKEHTQSRKPEGISGTTGSARKLRKRRPI